MGALSTTLRKRRDSTQAITLDYELFADLPNEIKHAILAHLDAPSLCALAQTSRAFARLLSDPYVWQKCYEREFGARLPEILHDATPDEWCMLDAIDGESWRDRFIWRRRIGRLAHLLFFLSVSLSRARHGDDGHLRDLLWLVERKCHVYREGHVLVSPRQQLLATTILCAHLGGQLELLESLCKVLGQWHVTSVDIRAVHMVVSLIVSPGLREFLSSTLAPVVDSLIARDVMGTATADGAAWDDNVNHDLMLGVLSEVVNVLQGAMEQMDPLVVACLQRVAQLFAVSLRGSADPDADADPDDDLDLEGETFAFFRQLAIVVCFVPSFAAVFVTQAEEGGDALTPNDMRAFQLLSQFSFAAARGAPEWERRGDIVHDTAILQELLSGLCRAMLSQEVDVDGVRGVGVAVEGSTVAHALKVVHAGFLDICHRIQAAEGDADGVEAGAGVAAAEAEAGEAEAAEAEAEAEAEAAAGQFGGADPDDAMEPVAVVVVDTPDWDALVARLLPVLEDCRGGEPDIGETVLSSFQWWATRE